MTKYLVELKPERIDDLMAMVALYRPGPIAFIPEYIARKHNPKLVKYFDPRQEKFLASSYGILTYQDDVLYTAIELAGYNWEEVDKLRKAIGECATLGIRILPPDINESLTGFTIIALDRALWLKKGRAREEGKAIRF